MTNRHFLTVIVLAAIVIRFSYILSIPNHFMPDSFGYVAYARSLLSDGVYMCGIDGFLADRAPGYPFLIIPFILFFGRSFDTAICLAQAILDVAMIPLMFQVTFRYRGILSARVVAILLGFYPFSIFYGNLILTEVPIAVCGSLIFWMIDRIRAAPQTRLAVFLGLICGVAHLIKPFMLLFLAVMAIYCLMRARERYQALKIIAIASTVCLLLIAPWGIRNAIVFGKPVLASTMGGLVLYAGNNPMNRSGGGINNVDYQEPPETLKMLVRRAELAEKRRSGAITDSSFFEEMAEMELEQSRILKEKAIEWIRNNPTRFARLAVLKASRIWNPVLHAPDFKRPLLMVISALYMIPVLTLAVIGLWGCRSNLSGAILFAAFMILGVTLLHMVMIGSVRYREPVMPYVCVFAALGVGDVVNRFKRRRPL